MLSSKRLAMVWMLGSFSILARAGSIYMTGFETPPFTLGNINGQNGWSVFNSGSSSDNVNNVKAFTGTQSADVVPLPGGTQQTGILHVDTASGSNLIDFNAEIYIASSSTENEWQFAALGNFSLSQFIGGIDLFPTGVATDTIHAITAGFPVEGPFTLNTWHNVDLLMNFTTQKYTLSLDGTVIGSNLAFCGDGNNTCAGENVPEGTFSSFFHVFATLNSNDIGYADNWSISSAAAAPEPATFGLTGIALVAGALLLRRRA